MEWLDEMIIPDSGALQLLEKRMLQKLELDDKSKVHESELVAANLLYINLESKENQLKEYDSRLKASMVLLVDKMLGRPDSVNFETITSESVDIEKAELEKQDSASTLNDEPKKNVPKISSKFILFLAECEVIKKIAGVKSELGEAVPSKEEESDSKRLSRWAGVGLAAVGGGLVIGVTGGLAAPLIAAGLGTLGTSLGVAGAAASFTALG
ncbi:hypothetical protein HDV04_003114, partial [Boothiomyces sp. JEL0838]